MFDRIKDTLGQAKGRALREIKKVDVSSYVDKALDTKDDVIRRFDEATSKFQTDVNEYVKKPVKIKAAKYTYPLSDEISAWMGISAGAQRKEKGRPAELEIKTLEDGVILKVTHIATEGDMIIEGIQGEFYACKPDIFEESYKRA